MDDDVLELVRENIRKNKESYIEMGAVDQASADEKAR